MPVAGTRPVTTAMFRKVWSPVRGHEAHHQQGAEPVPGVEGDPEAPEDQQGEHQHDDAGSHQTQLLADHGEDAVVVLLGQVQELLAALAQAHAQQAAGADGNEALGDLPAAAPIPLGVEGVPPGVDAVFPVVQDALCTRITYRVPTRPTPPMPRGISQPLMPPTIISTMPVQTMRMVPDRWGSRIIRRAMTPRIST